MQEKDKDICKEYLGELKNECMKTRVYEEENTERNEGEYQRDFTRIMYSSSFRRLQGKMQLLGLKNNSFFRNRLTHSLEVAQIARSIAEEVGYDSKESFVVEAGSLAHDIGNPPFGHAGERVLNDVYMSIGGFEGNAQTLRILTKLERKRPEYRGLNLTPRTLLACIKYFAKAEDSKFSTNKKFIFDDNYEDILKFIRDNHITIRTLDVQIVDIADEIAYAAHDLEDGLRVKAFTIDDILQEFWNRCNTKNEKKKLSVEAFENFENIVVEAKANAGYKKGTKITSSEYLQLFGKELASKIIYHAIHGVGMVEVNKQFKDKTNTKRSSELGFPENKVRDLVAGLKDIVFECINHTSDVYHYEQQGEKVIRYLANFYKKEGGVKYLPPEFRADAWEEYGKPKSQDRLTCDYIAGMMDSYAIELYEKYSGEKIQV